MKKQNRTLIILFAIFTGIVVLITTVVLLLPYITSNDQVKIPDVTNMTVVDAIAKLQDEGFEVAPEQIEKPSEDIPEGNVVITSPAGGTKHKKGYEVTIYVSSGNKQVEILDYTGKNYYEVKGNLEAQGITVIIESEVVENTEEETYKQDTIFKQSVEPGESLTAGDIITLYIPTIKNVYPDFTDGSYKVSEIVDFCEEYGVIVKFSINNKTAASLDNPSEYNDYKIVKQSREAGKKMTNGASIVIYITGEESEQEEIDNELD